MSSLFSVALSVLCLYFLDLFLAVKSGSTSGFAKEEMLSHATVPWLQDGPVSGFAGVDFGSLYFPANGGHVGWVTGCSVQDGFIFLITFRLFLSETADGAVASGLIAFLLKGLIYNLQKPASMTFGMKLFS
jgi:hypothetical protein